VRLALVVYGGVHRSGRHRVVPALLALVERLARRHELHVFALAQEREPCTYPLAGATVHNLGVLPAPVGQGMLRAVPALVRAMRAVGGFDVVHGYMGTPAAAVAAVAARWLRIPLVATFDGNELVALPEIGYGLGLRWRGRLLRRLVERSAARLTVCTGYMERLARTLGMKPQVVPLGVDPALVPPGPPTPPGPPWRLVHVASLNPVKDQPTLLRAFARLREDVPDVHLDVVGEDTLGGAVQADCRRLGQDNDGHVVFHGLRPVDEVWPFYRRAHLLVLPSRHDAAAVAVLEAAVCGVPTVGTDVGYMSDWAPQGAARTVAVGDAPALARAIRGLLADDEARARMGEAARALARARDADWTARRFEEIYAEVARPLSGGAGS
jgi:glycosyltransferase involved in cell wall biosynthesis